jgi:hypothetical protein
VNLIQADIEFRIPMSFMPDGFYYWTHTWIYDLDNPPVGITSLQQISVMQHNGTLSNVQPIRLQRTTPPYSGVPFSKIVSFGDHGLLAVGESWSIFNTVRLSFWAGGKFVGYKRWRVPLRDIDIVDGKLSADIYNLFNSTIGPGLLVAKICSRDGTPIDAVTVSPLVHMWQWRHGTKRRTGHVIVIP